MTFSVVGADFGVYCRILWGRWGTLSVKDELVTFLLFAPTAQGSSSASKAVATVNLGCQLDWI